MKVFKEIMSYVVIILVVVLIRVFIVTPVRVDGTSMYPTLNNNDILIEKKFDKSIDRFDVVVINYKKEKLVKRVIGLPGEKIEYKDNKLYINDIEIEEEFLHEVTRDFSLADIDEEIIPDDYYFVVGDNRPNSKDSRMIGLINKNQIRGKTSFVVYPFDKIGNVK